MAEIGEREQELLTGTNFANVATFRKDGTILLAVVWVDTDGTDVLVNSAERRDWPTNLKRDPRVSVSVPNAENPYEYVTIRGQVTETTTDGADAHIDKLAKRYLNEDSYPFRQPGEVRIILRIAPDNVRHVAQ